MPVPSADTRTVPALPLISNWFLIASASRCDGADANKTLIIQISFECESFRKIEAAFLAFTLGSG